MRFNTANYAFAVVRLFYISMQSGEKIIASLIVTIEFY